MRTVGTVLLAFALAACHVENIVNSQDIDHIPRFPGCDLNPDYLIAAAGRDQIHSLDDPSWVRADVEVPDYLQPDTRVIGVQVFGLEYAIPFNLMWHHEIVNLDPGGPLGPQLAITYCPLTGSTVVFDRKSIGGTTIGISGILFMNNLVLFDRSGEMESLWPQMMGEARCGPQAGAELGRYHFVEMEWEEWVALHPLTFVLAQDQGFDPIFFDYTWHGYPYGLYREDPAFWRETIVMPPLDRRRFAKERVIGLRPTDTDPGIAFPFGALTEREAGVLAVDFEYDGESAVLLWSDDAQGGSAYWPATEDGEPVTLRVTAFGIADEETGSRWTVDGNAVAGPLEGARLVGIESAHTAFWGAWWAFNPTTRLWE
jgi:hypothetical protein